MNRFLRGVALLVLSMSAVTAVAQNLVVAQAVLEDRSGKETVSDVVRGQWGDKKPILPFGKLHEALWIRLRIHAPAHGDKVVLYLLPSFMNDVRLYEAGPGEPSSWKMRVTGDFYPYSTRDRASFSLGFVLDAKAAEQTYYLRVQNRGPLQVLALALTPEAAVEKDHRHDLLAVFFVTSMLGLLIWAVHAYFLEREKVVGLFALHQATYTFFGLVACGYLAPVSLQGVVEMGDWVGGLLYFLINFTIALFCRELFRLYGLPRFWMRGFKLILWSFPVLCLGYAIGWADLAAHANALLIRVTWIYLAAMTFLLQGEGVPRKRFLQILFLLVLLNNLVFWFITHGNLPLAEDDLGIVQVLIVDGLVIGGLFALLLHARMRRKLQESRHTELRLQRVRRRFEREQALKKQMEIQAQTDSLTKLSNRGHFLESVEHELDHAIQLQKPLSLVVIDVDHFKQVNDSWGHRTGDAVLQEIANLLRNSLRTEDYLGRIGGEEFAAVMVEMEGENSIKAAQRLRTAIAESWVELAGGRRIRISISIGLTQLQGRKIDLNTLFDEADEALYCAKSAGRNRVFVSAEMAEEAGGRSIDATEWMARC